MKTPSQPMPGAADVTAPAMIEIFKAGKHVDMHGKEVEFTEQHLADIATGYDPKASEAPLVIGHPKLDAPAFGWVDKLVAKGKSLFAVPHQVDPAFAAMHNEGKFKKRSASFLLPEAANNPTPGKFYLRHVGFLGATAPAVKGLQDFTFADGGEGIAEFADAMKERWGWSAIADMFRALRDRIIETDGLEKANQVLSDYQIETVRQAAEADASETPALYAEPPADPSPAEDTDVTDKTAEFAAREKKLADDAAALSAREKKIADTESKAAREEAVSYADGLVKAGKLLPRQKPGVVELILAVGSATQSLSFAEGDTTVEKPAAAVLRELFDTLPAKIDFAEKSRDDSRVSDTLDFAAPTGTHVDPEKAALWSKAKAHQAKNPGLSLVDAYRAVGGA